MLSAGCTLCPLLLLLFLESINGLQCRCRGNELYGQNCHSNGTCSTRPGALCYRAIVIDYLQPDHLLKRDVYGCLNVTEGEKDWLPQTQFPLTCRNSKLTASETTIECCQGDYCNDMLNISLATETTPAVGVTTETDLNVTSTRESEPLPQVVQYALAIIIPVAIICVVCLILFLYIYHKRPHHTGGSFDTETDPMLPGTAAGSTLQEFLDFSNSGSGGGAGLPLMMQITIARQIQLEEVVGMGRFGDVKRGRWRGDNVAVKIFHSREEASWFREAEIYQTCLLRHDNILGFIAADNIDNGTLTQLLLVTEFHERGSLFNHLNDINELDIDAMVTICHTIACGLAHLHMEIFGKQGKPAIAHRDLKSKNILVKKDGITCCIADMGLAVKHESSTDTVNMPTMNDRVGTNRYMAPEVLSDGINMHSFDSYKQGDVYSLALVFWEVVRRVNVGEKGSCDEYQMPYYDLVPSDPTIENMRHVVCEKNLRPTITNRWHDTPSMKTMAKLLKECWHEKAAARLTALRVKKTLTSLAESEKVRYVSV